MLILNPDVLILDEATTALDKKTARQLMDLLLRYQRETGLAYVFISHDLGVLAEMADSLMIMQNGQIVESGATRKVLQNPKDRYTKTLVQDSFLTI